jgi:hypothetical protein
MAQPKPWERYGSNAPQPIVPQDPVKRQRDIAEAERAAAEARATAVTAPAEARKAAADAAVAETEAVQTQREAERIATAEQQKATRQAFRTEAVLDAIREARRIAQERGGTGAEGLLAGLPATDARALKTALDPVKGNLSFGRLQEMRDESVTGGALGQVSNIELELLASTVASLDPLVDRQTFLDRLDKVERYFIDAQLSNDGYAKDDPARRELMRNEFGYTGVFEGEEPAETATLGRADATETAMEIPPEYQARHLRYLRDNWGNMSPEGYARFRAGLDEAYGFTPDLEAYSSAVTGFNQAAAEGVTPEEFGAVPNPSRPLGTLEQGINRAAQSPLGAGFANASNALLAGLPVAAAGEQEKLNLLREARPISSTVGELVGSGIGAAALGGAGGAGRLAGSLLSKPLAAEVAHSTVYGATQDDNMLRGAGTGALGSLAGGAIGRQIGRAFPEQIAPGAYNRARESVPDIQDLKDQAAREYADVEARGVTADPAATQQLLERAQAILRGEGRITPANRLIDPDTPTRQAMTLIEDYAGQAMGPRQAGAVRNVLGEGVMSNDPTQRRMSRLLLDEFDRWADPVLPGVDVPRATSSRYLQGQQIDNTLERSLRRGRRQKGNDEGDAVRTQFGQLDERIASGQAYFRPEVADAVANVAQGDRLTNAMRTAGKFGAQNPLTMGMTGGAFGGGAYAMGVDPLLSGGIAITALGAGSAARKAANDRTIRLAEETRNLALGGQEYADLLEFARQEAMKRGGGMLGGIFGASANIATRQPQR